MSLTIRRKSGEILIWHVGQEIPVDKINIDNAPVIDCKKLTDIVYVYADGHELEHIRNRISNLPIGYGCFTWRDELAQLVYDNI